jgi:hypothetical protein
MFSRFEQRWMKKLEQRWIHRFQQRWIHRLSMTIEFFKNFLS